LIEYGDGGHSGREEVRSQHDCWTKMNNICGSPSNKIVPLQVACVAAAKEEDQQRWILDEFAMVFRNSHTFCPASAGRGVRLPSMMRK